MITIEYIDTPPGANRSRRVRFSEISETITAPAAVIKKLDIKPGDTFPDTIDLELLINEYAEELARARILKLVSMRDYSVFELNKKLTEDGYSREVIETALAFAKDIGAADDERFLHAFIRSRLSMGDGQQRIVNALRKKGFDKKQVDLVYMEHIDDDILELQISKAVRLIQNLDLDDYKSRDKAFKKIVGRGYSFDTAKIAINTCVEQRKLEYDERYES